jgi:hypothetical protein
LHLSASKEQEVTIKRTHRNAIYSTDPTASDVARFLGRRAITTRERHEPVMTTRALPIEELYPSLFEEPRLPNLLSNAAAAAAAGLTAAIALLRRRFAGHRADGAPIAFPNEPFNAYAEK